MQVTFLWSGGDEFVGLAMQAVAQSPARIVAGDCHRSHDLAHVGQAAKEVAASACPRAKVVVRRVELVRARVERRSDRP